MARPGVINRTSAVQASTQAVAAGSISMQTPSFLRQKGSENYDLSGVVADRNPAMGQQHDPASNLAVLTCVDGLEAASAEKGLQHDGELEDAEAGAQAALDAAAEGNPGVCGRARVEEALGTEFGRTVVGG